MDFINNKSYQADLNYVRTSMKMPLLERDYEKKLAESWAFQGDEKSLHILICCYIRLVISIALRYRHYGLPVSDLIQEGNLGLLEAAKRFNPEREVRFSAYAKWWIRAYIQDFILRNWSIVRTGSTTSQKALFFNLNRLRNRISDTHKDFLNPEEHQAISSLLHVPLEEVQKMESRLSHHDLSLNTTPKEGNDNYWLDLLSDPRPNPEENSFQEHDNHIRHVWLTEALSCLTVVEKLIITKRWLHDPSQTLESLGKELCFTKERTRQLEARAIRKLRYFLIGNAHEARQMLG